MSIENYPTFNFPSDVEKLYLAFLEGNTETAKRLNKLLSDESISQALEESLSTPLINKMLVEDAFECNKAIHTDPNRAKLIYFIRLMALHDCFQIFYDLFLHSTGKATLDDAISEFNLHECAGKIITLFIEIVSKIANSCNENPYGGITFEEPRITS